MLCGWNRQCQVVGNKDTSAVGHEWSSDAVIEDPLSSVRIDSTQAVVKKNVLRVGVQSSGKRNTLLLADDMSSNRDFLHSLFEEDFQILEAENGGETLKIIEEHGEQIAAVLLDIIMPVKDGYQVLAEMNEKGYLEDIPVIVVTSDSNLKSEARALELG